MASWQSFVLSYYLKKYVKGRGKDNEALMVRATRFKLERTLGKPTIPKKARITPFSEETLRGEWVEWNGQRAKKTLLYLHGGGYVACSPKTHRNLTVALAKMLNVRVLALDYRLAPENRFPAALEDAEAAYNWLLRNGVSPQNLFLSGDSAGGGLALSLLLKLRDQNQPLPAAAMVFSPWTDLAATGQSLETNDASDVMFHGSGIRFGAKIYPGPNNDPKNPYISALYGDFRGLPPLLIFASQQEVLRDDALRVAEKAKQQGILVDLQLWPKMPHAWPVFVKILPEARKAVKYVAAFTTNL